MSGKYESPKFLSPEAKTLIKDILNIDPTKRISIEKIRKSKFYTKNICTKEP